MTRWRLSSIYVCVYIYIYMKLLSGPSRGYYLVQVCLLSYFYPIIWQFSKNSLFYQKGRRNSFLFFVFNFSVLKLIFENYPFYVGQKHYKIGVSASFMFLLFKQRKNENNDSWNFWIWVFWSKHGRFLTHMFQIAEAPIFYSVSGVRAFWAKLSTKEILDTHQKTF